jgi:3-oxoacyl-[acyl-carrier protein] reductase
MNRPLVENVRTSSKSGDMRRTAVVLAGSEGLGRAAAQHLSQQGHRVVLFSRSKDKLEEARAELAAQGGEVLTVPGDLGSAADLDRLFVSAKERFGAIDILVNNSGGPRAGSLLDLTDEDWRTAFEEQAVSLMRAIRRVVPDMRERRWGRIITIASLSVKTPIDGLDLSNFMRGGLAAVHRTLARSLAPYDINVHMVLPGSIMTGRSRALIEGRARRGGVSFDEALSSSIARIPKGRLGRPEDVGSVVAFLASEAASYLTGNFIRVDGGLYAGLD